MQGRNSELDRVRREELKAFLAVFDQTGPKLDTLLASELTALGWLRQHLDANLTWPQLAAKVEGNPNNIRNAVSVFLRKYRAEAAA